MGVRVHIYILNPMFDNCKRAKSCRDSWHFNTFWNPHRAHSFSNVTFSKWFSSFVHFATSKCTHVYTYIYPKRVHVYINRSVQMILEVEILEITLFPLCVYTCKFCIVLGIATGTIHMYSHKLLCRMVILLKISIYWNVLYVRIGSVECRDTAIWRWDGEREWEWEICIFVVSSVHWQCGCWWWRW